MNHPNVCQVYEIGEHRDDLFIAMELLEGEPLATRLRHGPLQPAQEGRQRAERAFDRANGPILLGLRVGETPIQSNPERRS